MAVYENPLLYNVEIILKQPKDYDAGHHLVEFELKDVRQVDFDTDTGVFFASMVDGTVCMTPKENVYNVWIRPKAVEQ